MSVFTGMGRLIALVLRRDRIALPVWIFGTAVMLAAFAAATIDAYPTQADWTAHAVANTPIVAARFFNGVIYGTNEGATIMSETLVFTTIFPALMSIFAITRHTRQNEEMGRGELVGATAVGHFASLGAAITVVTLANILLGIFAALGLIAVGLEPVGSFAAGAVLAAVGIVFMAITALIAQVMVTARATNALAGALLGAAYLIRGIGDAMATVAPDGLSAQSAWPIWLSPIGWTEKIFPYTDNAWDFLLLPVGCAIILCAAAFVLVNHRDLAGGFVEPRRGRTHASRWLQGAYGLAWRLQRGIFYSWLAAIAVTGVTMGAVGKQITDILDATPSIQKSLEQLGGTDVVNAYFILVMNIIGVCVAGFIVQAMLRLRAEEANGYIELVLTTGVSRVRWLMSHILIAVVGAVMILALSGIVTGLTFGISVNDVWHHTYELTKLAMLQLPGILVVGGFVIAVFAVLPRASVMFSWAYFAICFLIMYLGLMLKFPKWLMDISPFTFVPTAYTWSELSSGLVLCAVAIVLAILSVSVFRKRSLA